MKIWTATYTHQVDESWSVTFVGKTEQEAIDKLIADFQKDDEDGHVTTIKDLKLDGEITTDKHEV